MLTTSEIWHKICAATTQINGAVFSSLYKTHLFHKGNTQCLVVICAGALVPAVLP